MCGGFYLESCLTCEELVGIFTWRVSDCEELVGRSITQLSA